MCTQQREIVNKYTGKKLYVKCGHCPACLQEKAAHRVSRIKAQDSDALECIMVTLTYRRNDCPYIYHDEAYWFSQGLLGYSDLDTKSFHSYNLNVYRDNNYRKVRVSSDYKIEYTNVGRKVLCDIPPLFNQDNHYMKLPFKNMKDLAHVHNKIGICYYPDVQEFVARLRINLNRHYDFRETFKAYCCSEYGSKSQRPHFHLLLWIPKGTFSTFRSAIVESWPFGDLQNFGRSIEKAFRASSYVASYVNCSADFPVFLKTYFKPKHSYSKDFGLNLNVYGLCSILSRFKRGSLTYFKKVTREGKPVITECILPQYVISRYFPKFKGYSRIDTLKVCELAERFARFDYRQRYDLNSPQVYGINRLAFPVYYTGDEVYKISVRLNNAYTRFLFNAPAGFNISFSDYMRLHFKIWSCYQSNILRLHLTNDTIPLREHYDNLEEVKCKSFDYDTNTFKLDNLPIGFDKSMFVDTNPNNYISVILSTLVFTESYHDHVKHRNVNNAVYSSLYEEF